MKGLIKNLLFFFIVLVLPDPLKGQVRQVQSNESEMHKAIWGKIKPFFEPPSIYKGKMGKYRSPLIFENGKQVKTADDWKERRSEIYNRWNNLMGEWPPLIENQDIEILDVAKRDGFTEYHIRYKWMPNEKTEGYLLVPFENGKKPAVITVFYEPETAIGRGRPTPNLDFAYQLTKRGFVTLSVGTAKATESKTFSLYYPNIDSATVQPLSMLAYAAANSWFVLANLAEVDSTRIGIMGLSFGGKWAMFASCLFDKFACAVWSDPGIVFDNTREAINYWEPWYLGYYPKPWRKRGMVTKDNPAKGLYPELIANGYDLHELHALMAPRPFLVSGGSEDTPNRWVPLNHTIAVNNILGFKNRVAMTNRKTHLPDSMSNETAYLFFEYFLKGDGK